MGRTIESHSTVVWENTGHIQILTASVLPSIHFLFTPRFIRYELSFQCNISYIYEQHAPYSEREREGDTLSEHTFPILPLFSFITVLALLHFGTVKLELQARREILCVHVWLSIHACNSTVPDSCPLSFFCYCYCNSVIDCFSIAVQRTWCMYHVFSVHAG